MIEVENLQKDYGPARALQGISFQVRRGEVVGFLGPNGAGKSTTMRILTGYLLPTGGRASVLGMDVVNESLAVRQRIGYLPESTPLYTEMRVDEYLRFAAEIRGVPGRDVKRAVARVVDACGLERVVGKDIHELSKGYRQRVGLAQAMVHEPDLLILDEPTSGLDPNQIVEVRALIQRLGTEHTVLLSTHYLQEVEAACSRVLVIDRGRLVADGTRDELVAALPLGGVLLRVAADRAALARALQLPVDDLIELPADRGIRGFRLAVSLLPEHEIARRITAAGIALHELAPLRPSLEDAFRSLTLGSDPGGRLGAQGSTGNERIGDESAEDGASREGGGID